MESLKEIIKGTEAKLIHICNGKIYYSIKTEKHTYQLEINSLDKDWKDVYILPQYKAITLMRWIRDAINNKSDAFIKLI